MSATIYAHTCDTTQGYHSKSVDCTQARAHALSHTHLCATLQSAGAPHGRAGGAAQPCKQQQRGWRHGLPGSGPGAPCQAPPGSAAAPTPQQWFRWRSRATINGHAQPGGRAAATTQAALCLGIPHGPEADCACVCGGRKGGAGPHHAPAPGCGGAEIRLQLQMRLGCSLFRFCRWAFVPGVCELQKP